MKWLDDYLNMFSSKFKIDLTYFVHSGFWLSLTHIFGVLKSLILIYFLANFLPTEMFGQYSYIIATISIASMFSLPGLQTSILQGVARGFDGTYNYCLKKIFKYSWLGSLLLLIISLYGFFQERFLGSKIFLLLVFLFPFYSVTSFYVFFFQAKKLFKEYTFISFIWNFISTLTLVLVILITKSLFLIIFVQILLTIFFQGYFTFIYYKKYASNLEKVNADDVNYGYKLSWIHLFSILTSHLGSFLLPLFGGFLSLAIYTIAQKIPNTIIIFVRQFTKSFIPKLVQNKSLDKKSLRRFYFFFFLFSFFLYLITIYFINPLIIQFFFSGYMDSITIANYLSLLILAIPNSLVLQYINSVRDLKTASFLIIFSKSFNLILLIALLKPLGIMAIVISQVLPELILIFFYLYYLYN